MMRSVFAMAILALVAAAGCRAQDAKLLSLDSFPKTTLQIRSAEHTYSFDIWLAQTPSSRSRD